MIRSAQKRPEVGMEYRIQNGNSALTVSSHGAEAVSLKKDGTEYLWNGDPKYWGRHAPVLFPFVGQVRDKKYRYEGQEYPMGQHGFARDSEFRLLEQKDHELLFALSANEETRKVYPFDFELLIRYTLHASGNLQVEWTVKNPGSKNLYFSIGGHPAFLCPIGKRGEWKDYRILFRKAGQPLNAITIRPITTGGNVGHATKTHPLQDGTIVPTDELFAGDALILEGEQADEISLVDPDGKEYLTVNFSSPLVGVWTPAGKHAPFICIEPWYGRTDADDFTGTLEEREYSQVLKPGETFEKSFTVTF